MNISTSTSTSLSESMQNLEIHYATSEPQANLFCDLRIISDRRINLSSQNNLTIDPVYISISKINCKAPYATLNSNGRLISICPQHTSFIKELSRLIKNLSCVREIPLKIIN